MMRMDIRWAGLDLLARFRIREGMGLCVDMMNEYEWGRVQDRCTKPLETYGGAAKEMIPRLRETIVAMRKGYEENFWNSSLKQDTAAIEKLIKKIQADKEPAHVLSIAEFTAKKEQQSETGKPQRQFKGPVKVFILAGQSNMEGHAGVQTLDRLGEHPTHGYLLKKIKNAMARSLCAMTCSSPIRKKTSTSNARCQWAWVHGVRIGLGRNSCLASRWAITSKNRSC
jgi:hypothetical protein